MHQGTESMVNRPTLGKPYMRLSNQKGISRTFGQDTFRWYARSPLYLRSRTHQCVSSLEDEEYQSASTRIDFLWIYRGYCRCEVIEITGFRMGNCFQTSGPSIVLVKSGKPVRNRVWPKCPYRPSDSMHILGLWYQSQLSKAQVINHI